MTRTRLAVKVMTTAAVLVLCAAIAYAGESPTAGGALPDEKTGMEFVFVKGGCYQMGDTFGGVDGDEKPVHEVCVSDFYIGKFEVTQGEWRRLWGATRRISRKAPATRWNR